MKLTSEQIKDYHRLIEENFPEVSVIDKPVVGGQKVVFPCMDNGQMIALKFVKIAYNDEYEIMNSSAENRIIRELSIMGQVHSEFFVKPIEKPIKRTIVKGAYFLIYEEEWVDGISVDKMFKTQNYCIKDVVQLGIDMAEAIKVLWSKKIIHRDIKPANIIRQKDGHYVLLDLGIAYDLNAESLTQIGERPGTYYYMSPEQVSLNDKRKLDFRSDLYSLGLVMYESFTHCNPIYTAACRGECNNAADFIPCNLVDIIPKINTKLADIIMRMLKKHPNMRFRNIDYVILGLKAVEKEMEA